ncbi:hypothetical protein LK07_15040 [Streptomyces pluripotens]|uniref:DUF5666 domain-containing protein n=1 Tax=Streptomyces pluripotens TaxID=1355015 RepID=A0A221NYR5_9ACTN|nr:hypothetical protein [Streptomyces pluripotens]ARP70870.1 hypothetical protein LK06_013900 [Streptomyces pluripotens]ASN25127.1 hypothetical protein LK07_15040 [Streptomyces pluripotens]
MARRRTELVKADDARTELLPLVPAPSGTEAASDASEVEAVQGPGGATAEPPEDVLAEPPDARDISAELAAPPRRRLPWLTLVLAAGAVAAGAFTGGVLVEKGHLQNPPGAASGRGFTFSGGTGSRAGAGASARAGGGRTFGQGAGGTGASNGAGAGSGVTFGTVKLVDGKTIYVTDAQGDIVKVTTGGSTKVTESKEGKIGDLQPGQTVTIRGSQNADGDIAATTVTEGGPGGGFGGFGRSNGGTGSRSGGN